MTERVIVMLLNANPDVPATLAAPFFHAAAAAAMDLEVEVHFATRAVLLLQRGFAEKLYPGEDQEKSVYEFMRQAHRAGAKFYGCSHSMAAFGLSEDTAILELDGTRGAAAFIGAAIADGSLTLTY